MSKPQAKKDDSLTVVIYSNKCVVDSHISSLLQNEILKRSHEQHAVVHCKDAVRSKGCMISHCADAKTYKWLLSLKAICLKLHDIDPKHPEDDAYRSFHIHPMSYFKGHIFVTRHIVKSDDLHDQNENIKETVICTFRSNEHSYTIIKIAEDSLEKLKKQNFKLFYRMGEITLEPFDPKKFNINDLKKVPPYILSTHFEENNLHQNLGKLNIKA